MVECKKIFYYTLLHQQGDNFIEMLMSKFMTTYRIKLRVTGVKKTKKKRKKKHYLVNIKAKNLFHAKGLYARQY